MLPKFGEVLGLKSPFAAEMLLLQACSRSPPSHTRSCVLASEVMVDSDAGFGVGGRGGRVGACAQGRQRIPCSSGHFPFLCRSSLALRWPRTFLPSQNLDF